MGDNILSQQAVDIYSDLKISPSQYILKKRNEFSRRVGKEDTSKPYISPQHTNLKFRNFAEENVFNVLANQSMLQTEVWKSQMALNDELIAAQVLEREERQKRAVKYQKLLEEVEKLSHSNHQKEDKIYQLVVQNSNLKKNICSLYKTAKSEVEQKNCLLLDANEKCDRLRRKLSKKNKFHQSEQESVTARPLEISRTKKEKSGPSSADRIRENSEDCKASHRKRRYYDCKERDFKSKSSGNFSIRFHKKEVNKRCKDICTKKCPFTKYPNCKSKGFYSERYESSTVKKNNNISREPTKNLLNSKVTKKVNAIKKIQSRKKVELNKITEKQFLKCYSIASPSNKSKKIEDNLVLKSCCTDNTLTPADTLCRKSNNSNHISVNADQNIECNQISESNSLFAEQKVDKKHKFLQTLSVNSNLLTPMPTYKKSLENDRVSTVVNKAEHDEDLSYSPSENEGNKYTPDFPDVGKYNFLNDKTTTNALFFGLLPKEIREKFLEYEQKLIAMINNLKQNFVSYCSNSTMNNLLGVFPEAITQTFIDYEQRLIILTNRLKQTFVNSCLTNAENEAQESSVSTSNKTQPNFEKQDDVNEIQANSNKLVSDLPSLLLKQGEFKVTKNLDSSHLPNKFPLLIDTAVIEMKSVNDVSKNELEIKCEKNETKTIEEIIKNEVKQSQIYKCVENPLTSLSNENDPVCSQDDEKNSDSTQKVPSYYREIFLSNDKNTCNVVNNTSSLNSILMNDSKDNDSVSSKSVSVDSSHSDQADIHLRSSGSFHPSLSSVYYRRQLLKAAIEEKTEKGLSKLTKENINNLYRFRKTKIPFVGNKKEQNID